MSTLKLSLDAIDNINRSLAKSIAVTNLLINDGQNIKAGFLCSHSLIMNAIWDLSDHLNDIQKELEVTHG